MINILKAPLILILVLAVFLKSFSQSAADTAGIKKVRALAGTASVYQKSNAAAALNYYQKALALAKSKHLYKQQIAILNNIADLYHQQKDSPAAFNTKAEQYYIADRFILKEMSRRIARLQAADRQGLPGAPPDLQAGLYVKALLPSLAPATQSALAQANAPADWNLLFLSSPEFMRR
mgnify:CR=1 FL=1